MQKGRQDRHTDIQTYTDIYRHVERQTEIHKEINVPQRKAYRDIQKGIST